MPPPIPAPALDLQREYAGHVLILRGALPNADAARAPDAEYLNLERHEDGYVQEGKEVAVEGLLETAPVAAFVGRLPMQVRTEYTEAGSAKVFLKIPQGFEQGHVQLRWPTTTISARPRLRRRIEPAFLPFELLQKEGGPGDLIAIGRFDSEPIEVHIGGEPVAEFLWEDGVLGAPVPRDALRGRVLVVTSDKRYHQSLDFFQPHGVMAA